ncbi:hypothetical protein OPT61_g4102 [Boeremia exigua]|uniref:Uncharacterized protein n=1 Tax=Boeremia exigua TaxID=749465 RepID=A0ACC2IFE8_9PLEO|nr:hypothetical protein OPT61_g4102 [Boeremia exigua]
MKARFGTGRLGPPFRIFRAWGFEIATIILAGGLMVAIAVLLASYDGKPTPDWGVNLNLNALLALLSTILRAALVIIIAQVISQRKWDWFAGAARPISDLQQFDSGSRGSLGALLLLRTVLFKDAITLVSACVLIVSFLVGPFVQQASRTAECSFPVPGLNASIPYAHYVPRKAAYESASALGHPTSGMLAAILSSVMAPTGVENQIVTSCGTGNCTFAGPEGYGDDTVSSRLESASTHSTVAMCNKCTDVQSLVERRMINQSVDLGSGESYYRAQNLYTLPNSMNISAEVNDVFSSVMKMEVTGDLEWMGDLFSADLRASSRWAYSNVTYLAKGSNDTVEASVCILYPCMRTYRTSITNNQLSEELVHSEPLLPDLATAIDLDRPQRESFEQMTVSFRDLVAVQLPCVADGQTLQSLGDPQSGWTRLALYDFTDYSNALPYSYTGNNFTAPESCIYRHDATLASTIANVFRDEVFSGQCNAYKSLNCMATSTGRDNDINTLGNMAIGTVLRTLHNDYNTNFAHTNAWFHSFADAMTTKFRSEYGAMGKDGIFAPNTASDDLPLDTIQGVAWQTQTCVAMHWQWLLLPSSLTLITALLAIWTIFATWKQRGHQPVWKDSILPLIFYSDRIEPEDGAAQTSTDTGVSTAVAGTRPLMEDRELLSLARTIRVRTQWQDDSVEFTKETVTNVTGSVRPSSASTQSVESHILGGENAVATESGRLTVREDVAGRRPEGEEVIATESDGLMDCGADTAEVASRRSASVRGRGRTDRTNVMD